MALREVALSNPDKSAIIMAESGETRTYGELSERADQYANLFRQLGFSSGDAGKADLRRNQGSGLVVLIRHYGPAEGREDRTDQGLC